MSYLERFNTLRFRVILGEATLVVAIAVIALIGVAALQRVRNSVSQDLRVGTRIGQETGEMVAALFDEIRMAEQLLSDRSERTRTQFRAAGETAHTSRKQLSSFVGLTDDDRARVSRIGNIQSRVEAWYHFAHAQVDLGRGNAAATRNAAATARALAGELISQVREFSALQSLSNNTAADRLVSMSEDRESIIWLVTIVTVLLGAGVVTATVRSLANPLTRLVAVARRYSEGNLHMVKLGAMPRELEELGIALNAIGTRLRDLVREVTEQSTRIQGTAADLSAMSEQLAASGGMISTAMVEVANGAQAQVMSLDEGSKATQQLREAAGANVQHAVRVSEIGKEILRLAARHHKHVSATGNALLDLGSVVQTSAEQVQPR